MLRDIVDPRRPLAVGRTPVRVDDQQAHVLVKQRALDKSELGIKRTLLVALSSMVLLKNSRSSGRSTSFCAVERSTTVAGFECVGGGVVGANFSTAFCMRVDNP